MVKRQKSGRSGVTALMMSKNAQMTPLGMLGVGRIVSHKGTAAYLFYRISS